MRTIVLYHAPCIDGLVAAWSLGLDPKTTTYIEYDHGKPELAEKEFLIALPPVTPRVIAVDCFPEFIRGMAESVIVIDHHESARERLADRTGLTEVVFDMTHSAAVLAWRWAHPDHEIPNLHQYVEDRDLWKWECDGSDAVNAYIATQPMTFEALVSLRVDLELRHTADEIKAKGRAILAAQAQVVNATVSKAGRWIFEGVPCAVVNCTAHISETGHALVDGTDTPIAFLWRIDGDTMSVSVRTHRDSPLKANEIAERFGGGGHPQAAGFHLPASWPLTWLESA